MVCEEGIFKNLMLMTNEKKLIMMNETEFELFKKMFDFQSF